MTPLIIATIGTGVAVLAARRSIDHHGRMPLIDPIIEEHWLVRAFDDHPRIAAFVARRLNPASAGGLLLTVSLGLIFVLSVFAGWVFDTVDETSGFARFDESVAEWGAANATSTSTAIIGFLTDLGGTGFIVAVVVAASVYGWWRHENFHIVLFLVSVAVSQAVVNNGLKWIIERERPSISQLGGWAGSSFPSGHTAAAAATYAAVALVLGLAASRRTRAWLAGAAIAIAVVVGATRALLGVHWLTDVVAGLAVGWACFIACAVAFGGRIMHFGEPVVATAARAAGSHPIATTDAGER